MLNSIQHLMWGLRGAIKGNDLYTVGDYESPEESGQA